MHAKDKFNNFLANYVEIFNLRSVTRRVDFDC